MDGVLASAKAFKAEAEVVNEKLGANNKKEQPKLPPAAPPRGRCFQVGRFQVGRFQVGRFQVGRSQVGRVQIALGRRRRLPRAGGAAARSRHLDG